MRVNKAKFIRKYLRFYRIVFRLLEPYNIILDGNFIFQALKFKVDIQERLGKLLQESPIKLYIQQSVLDELKTVGQSAKDALYWAQKYCLPINDTTKKGSTPAEKLIDLMSTIFESWKSSTDSKRIQYIIASQDKDLRKELWKIPGVPTIYFNKVSLVLEPPSKASRNYGLTIENSKISLQSEEKLIVESVKPSKTLSIIGITASEPVKVDSKPRLKKKATAPNPLSSRPATKNSKAYKKKHEQKYKKM